MIPLERPARPTDFDQLSAIVKARDKVRALALQGAIKSELFDGCWSERRFKGLFERGAHGKCGFCEARHAVSGYLQVEHYRPKTAVTELPPLAEDVYTPPASPWKEREDEGAPDPRGRKTKLSGGGYWWLAYVWENWLLACEKCNGAKWKGNLFPACARDGGPRPALTEGCDAEEDALLLNPYGPHDPMDHLTFQPDGFVVPRNRSARGAETIRTCGLNREVLVRERQTKSTLVLEALLRYRDALPGEELEEALDELLAEASSEREFAGVARSLIEAWFGRDFVREWVTATSDRATSG